MRYILCNSFGFPGDPYTLSDYVYSDVSSMFAIIERYGPGYTKGEGRSEFSIMEYNVHTGVFVMESIKCISLWKFLLRDI